jgi:GAF domain-containing protein/anti-sigma regulatory factor (Ser/Thr protein kinase)
VVERGSDVAEQVAAEHPDSELWLELRTAETLRRISATLVSELDLERVLQHVTDAATELTGAQFGSFFYNHTSDNGESYMLYALSGVSREVFEDFPMPRNTPLFDPTFRGEGVVRLDDVTADPRFGQNPPYYGMPDGHLPVCSYLAAPVVSRTGEVLGGLFFGHTLPGVFTAQHERLVTGIAAPAAIAIDNARLYQAAQRERAAAERLAERLGQMQKISARLAGAKMVDEVAAVVVQGAPAALGCARASFFLLADDGKTLQLLHSVGYEGSLRVRWSRVDLSESLPVTDALRDRRMVTLSDETEWATRYPDAPPAATRSAAVAAIPLALGEQVFGVATVGWDEPRSFGADETQFLAALADQCAQALERARLYEVERETARTLQRSLLPPREPEIPGMDVAAVYRAGDRSVAVGGDFYDVFRIDTNRWGIAMGDVCGRGAHAAARTALVRYTLRAVGSRDDRPTDALRSLNRAVLAEPDADDRFCATVFGHLELDLCGAWVTLACAGHPRPVVVRRAGWIDQRGQPGTLIGVFEDLHVSEDRVGLGPGDSLLFFTDGITEARNVAGEQFADEGLPEILLRSTELDASTIAERVRRAALDFSGGTLGDDLAILVVRVPLDADLRPEERLRRALGSAGAVDEMVPGYPVPHGGQMRRPWPPREARIALPADAGSARAARRFLAGVLSSWRMPEMLEGDAALLLSELATNAILHAKSPFTVIVRWDGQHLRVEVGDGSRSEPRMRLRKVEDAPGGRGLMLIDTMSSSWGIMPTARGKRVWFELPVPEPRG